MVAEDVAVQGEGQRRGVVEAPRHRQRLLAQPGLALRREARVAQRPSGQPREQPDPQRAVAVALRLDGALEQRHQLRIVA
jgi:hypothetical protein